MDKTNNSYSELVMSIQKKAKEFDRHLTIIKSLNNELLERSEKVQLAIQDMLKTIKYKPKEYCSVCYTREPRICLIPCGHVFCTACTDRARSRNRCFTCRGTIDNAVRVYS